MESMPKLEMQHGAERRHPAEYIRELEEKAEQMVVEQASHLSPEAQRELFFKLFVTNRALISLEDDLEEADFEESEILEVLDALGALPMEDAWRVLSYPQEVRERLFGKYREAIDSGNLSPTEVVRDMQEKAEQYGFSIGFHTSPREIRPEANGQWLIRGTERDHRDDDLPMAFYARTYKTLYRKRRPEHLYLVRVADTDRNDGNWWRAPSLTIIDKLPLLQMEQFIGEMNGKVSSEMKKETSGHPMPKHQ